MSYQDQNMILETKFDIKWLKNVILRSCNQQNVEKYSLKSWSAEIIAQGLGYLSHIVKVELQWSASGQDDLPKSVVLKVPTVDAMNALAGELDVGEVVPQGFISDVHRIECAFYDLWKNQDPPCKIPRCYLAQPTAVNVTGILVLEDLSNNGTVACHDGLNLKQMLEIAENLAKIHAWSLTHSGWEDKFLPPDIRHLESFPEMMHQMLDGIKKDRPDLFTDELMDIAYKHCTLENFYYAFTVHKEYDMQPVLVHGDVGINNLLWKKETKHGAAAATNELLAFIDWQIVHPGCAMKDFVQCIWSSTQEEVRRNQTQAIFSLYYANLREFLGKKELPFSFDTLMKSYYRLIKFGLVGGLGPVIMSGKNDPIIAADPMKIDALMVRIRNMIQDATPFINIENGE